MSEIATTTEVVQYKTIQGDIQRAEELEKKVKFDYNDKKQLVEAKSHVHGLRKIKGSIERSRKEAKAYVLDLGRAIDGQAKEMESRVQALIAPHEAQFEAIERRESERKAALKMRVDAIAAFGVNRASDILSGTITAERLREGLAKVSAIVIDETYQECQKEAEAAKVAAIEYLSGAILQAEEHEKRQAEAKAQAEEVARLKAEAAERQRLADIEAAKREATEKAKQEAEAQLKQAAEEKARMEREALQREADAKMAAERAELRRLQEAEAAAKAAEQAKKEAAEREAAAVAKAKADAEAAAKAKQDAIDAAEAKRKAEEEKRKADEAHIAKIRGEILAAMGTMTREQVADAIMQGKIPHLKVIV